MNSVYLLTIFAGVLSVVAPSFGEAQIAGLSRNPEDAIFNYYRDRTRKEIVYKNRASTSSLKRQTNTVIIIDGFLSNDSSPMSQTTKDGFLATRKRLNVIVLDWGKLSGAEIPIRGAVHTALTYASVVANIGPLGERVADFIHFLQTNSDIAPNKVEIVGHSLGAHLAGASGFWLNKKYKQRISRITGLDPAGPMFSRQLNAKKKLEKGDADFVAIYHTNRGKLGDSSHGSGHIDVYVNGGAMQPGCEGTETAGLCSHSFSWKLFNACFTQTFTACPCSGIQCQCKDCNLTCPNPITLGYATSPSTRGAYRVKTRAL